MTAEEKRCEGGGFGLAVGRLLLLDEIGDLTVLVCQWGGCVGCVSGRIATHGK